MGFAAEPRGCGRGLLCRRSKGAESRSRRGQKQAKAAGMIVAAQLPLTLRREGKRAVEHFGFVDGVSQPIVRGTARANAGVAADASGRRRASSCSAIATSTVSIRPRPRCALRTTGPASCRGASHRLIMRAAAATARFRPQRLLPRRSPVRAACRQVQRLLQGGGRRNSTIRRSPRLGRRQDAWPLAGRHLAGAQSRKAARDEGRTMTSPSAPRIRRAIAARSDRPCTALQSARFARRGPRHADQDRQAPSHHARGTHLREAGQSRGARRKGAALHVPQCRYRAPVRVHPADLGLVQLLPRACRRKGPDDRFARRQGQVHHSLMGKASRC